MGDTSYPSELFLDILEPLLPSELFLDVAALYPSGESGLSSSNVPIDLRQRSTGVGLCDVFHALRSLLGVSGRTKSSAE